jgi:hypothetical protein
MDAARGRGHHPLRRPAATPRLAAIARLGTLTLSTAHEPGGGLARAPDVLADSRPATFWRLHRLSLKAAVHHFAPTVEIVDLD